jgi:hypothetical protein
MPVIEPMGKRKSVIKSCKYCNGEFEVNYYKRNVRKYCSKKCSNADPETKRKIAESQRKTYIEKYNVDHPMKTNKVKDNFKRSMLKKYGVENALCNDVIKQKVKDTKFDKYGDSNYNNIQKSKQTCLERYGVDNIRKSKQFKDKCFDTKNATEYSTLLEYAKQINVELLFDIQEFTGYRTDNIYSFKCNTCGKVFENYVYSLQNVFCSDCEVVIDYKTELFDFLKSETTYNIQTNVKKPFIGLPLDFYIEELNLAIELCDHKSHSEKAGKLNKTYRINKTNKCIMNGINLIHIFEYEWKQKAENIKSILRTKLNSNNIRKIFARKCEFVKLSKSEKNEFLQINHIQGKDKSSYEYGLKYKNEIVSVMTFCKSRFDKKIQYEISRFCNKLNTSVIGGTSKLFNCFINEVNPDTILSYADRRLFGGDVYRELGFEFFKNTSPGYHYITPDYKMIINRINFHKHKQKDKLQTFDPTLTEWENMKANGFDRIWDCGNLKWVYTKKPLK